MKYLVIVIVAVIILFLIVFLLSALKLAHITDNKILEAYDKEQKKDSEDNFK